MKKMTSDKSLLDPNDPLVEEANLQFNFSPYAFKERLPDQVPDEALDLGSHS